MHFHKKIKCPRHYVIKDGLQPYVMEIDPLLKNISRDAEISFGVTKWRPKRDKFGNKIINFRNFYQPEIYGSFAIHQVYDPKNIICMKCNKRCFEGQENVVTTGIQRLNT